MIIRMSRWKAQLVFLPSYSPAFNPIEIAFSKLKALVRKAVARIVNEPWSIVAASLAAFTSEEYRNPFAARSMSNLLWPFLGSTIFDKSLNQLGGVRIIIAHSIRLA
jgi:hypothetical protein